MTDSDPRLARICSCCAHRLPALYGSRVQCHARANTAPPRGKRRVGAGRMRAPRFADFSLLTHSLLVATWGQPALVNRMAAKGSSR